MKRFRYFLLFLLSISLFASETGPTIEYALLLPRSVIVRQIDREAMWTMLFSYGAPDSYAAGYMAGRAAVLREWLSTLDAATIPQPPYPPNPY